MTDLYPVKPEFAAKARITREQYQRDYQASIDDPDAFWGKAAERLDWFKKPTQIKDVNYALDDFRIRWFADGELNASVNCLDRQL
ncbi:MAG TPA: acetyl-coenzyme A synthetase N-terminal domain-containing protein, partial [Pseudoxanthomonas sp.]